VFKIKNKHRIHFKYIAFILILCFTATLVPLAPKSYKVKAGAIAELAGIEDDTGGFITDNTFDFATGKMSDFADETGKILISTGESENVVKYVPTRGVKLVKDGNRVLNLSNGLKAGGQILNIYNTSVDTYKLITETSKQETFIEKGIDKGLFAIDVGMGWYAIGLGAVAIFTAPAWGAGITAAATVTGTTYLVSKLGVGAARIAFNSETYRDTSRFVRNTVSGAYDLATGKKKLVFAPLQRPGMKEGLDIIEEELGFDLYPGLRREIPDPSTGIPVYKPNIYLYSDVDIIVNVKVYPEHWITESEPVYTIGRGWEANITNGSLNGWGDYLFYEAIVPDTEFQMKYGWEISCENRKNDMAQVLDKYGFNQKEKHDFLEYWMEKLDEETDYIFFPQENKKVDMIMPLVLSIVPDKVFRIWFYMVPAALIEKQNQYVEEPVITEKIRREGFSLTEWGGILK